MSNKGISNLGAAIHMRISAVGDKPNVFDLGTIKSDGSLLADQYPIPIPKDEYLICRSLVHDDPLTITNTVSSHSHTVNIPDSMAPIKAGDRVLIAWIGDDVVIIDVVYQGDV